MLKKKVLNIICTLLFVTYFFSSKANDSLLYELQTKIEYNFSEGNFEKALTLCDRLVYCSKDFSLSRYASIYKGRTLIQLQHYNEAKRVFSSIALVGLSDSSKCQILYYQALSDFLLHNYKESSVALTQIRDILQDTEFSEESFWLELLVNNELYAWDASVSRIENTRFLSSQQKTALLELYHHKPKIFRAKRIEWSSRILPGSGQIMLGHVGEGVVSFMLCASALSFGIYEIVMGYYVTGYVLGAGFLNSFFYGGLRRLELLTIHKNQTRVNGFNEKCKAILYNK